ncbi:MAG: hypothetical protein ACK55Z_32145, partial [bacterium]
MMERGSVVSKDGLLLLPRAVTGVIGAGAEVVRLTGGLSASLASIFPISLACKIGGKRAMRSVSLTLVP